MNEQLITSLLKLYIFLTQDLEKQREEIERLRALLIQHNILLESKQSMWTYLGCLSTQYMKMLLQSVILYVTDVSKSTVSTTVEDQHLRGDNGLLDHLWKFPGHFTGHFKHQVFAFNSGRNKKVIMILFWI